MDFMRRHWFDVGALLAVVVGGCLLMVRPAGLSLLLWISLVSLFIHQFEEYRFPGYFPGMINTVLFSSEQPDRYPLNANSALIINVLVGWLSYFLAAIFSTKAVWLGMATILVSAGNFVAHTFMFNIKGKTRYNPGMISAIVLFGPISVLFFSLVIRDGLATVADWVIGILLGIILNYVGILKLIDLLKDERSSHPFQKRLMMPPSRGGESQ